MEYRDGQENDSKDLRSLGTRNDKYFHIPIRTVQENSNYYHASISLDFQQKKRKHKEEAEREIVSNFRLDQ